MGLLIAISQENYSNSLKRIKYKNVTFTLLQAVCVAVSSEAEVSNAWNKLHF